jgi:hypothetical protein
MNLPLSYNADASTNNFLVTPNGDVGPRPFSPYFGGNYSFFTDSTANYLQIPSNAGLALGTSDFCIEYWVYPTSTTNRVITWAAANCPIMYMEPDQTLQFANYGISSILQSTAKIQLNQWTHCAVSRSSGVNRMFINGALVATTTNNQNWGQANVNIGVDISSNSANGYISNLRVVKGSAVYTAAFTPSTEPLRNIPNTILLTCQANRFIDNSTANSGSGFAITVAGSPRITDNSPFVSTDFTTGAGYFTGAATDYFRIADNAALDMGSGSFTIECFYYPAVSITTAQGSAVFGKRATGGTYGGVTGEFYETYAPKFVSTVNGSSWGVNITSSILCVQNQWNHIAWVRNGDAWTIYVNGQAGGSVNLSGTIPDNTADFTIGATESSASSYKLRQGYLSDFRVVKGAAVYTGNFTPPSLGMLRTSGAASAAAYPSTTNVNTSFAESATSLLTLQTRAPSQNINFIDSSPNEFIVTKNGNTTQGTFSPFSPTGWGNYFDGVSNTNYLSVARILDSNVDVTLECWVFMTAASPSNGAYVAAQYAGGADRTVFMVDSGVITMQFGSAVVAGTITVTRNQWVHLAWVRSGNSTNNWSQYVNGVRDGQLTYTGTYDNTPFTIGASNNLASTQFPGYISNMRLLKGTALYSGASFTPPSSPLTAIANTALLTCQSNRFLDQTGKTITRNGSPSVQAFSPFAPANAVSPLVTGGSGYFDGTTDYLTWGPGVSIAFGTGDFTVECWAYHTSAPTASYYIDARNASQTSTWALLNGLNATGDIGWFNGTTALVYSSVADAPKANSWSHIVYVRSGTTGSLYVNGVRVGTATDSTNYSVSPTISYIGARWAVSDFFSGYMMGVRIVKGTALYNPSSTTFAVPTTPPTAIPNTSLLLNFTNGAAVDATGKNNLESVGNAQNSGVQAKWDYLKGGSSMYFDGTTDYLQTNVATPDLYAFGSGDFTIECWIYLNNTTGAQIFYDGRPSGTQTTQPTLYVSSGQVLYYTNAANRITGSTLSTATWYHIALARSGTSTKLFVNGVQSGSTYTDSTVYTNTASRPQIGQDGFSGGNFFNGYIDDLRVTKGYARYVEGTGANAGKMVFNGTNTLALPTGPFPIG